ncbi:5-(carboxyamino)imidazole ribonucleotide synthase [Weissella diestrammenae]|uniref:N5-carboxyaminoimidazole ribonucleotide synthase n=1 Tax=Weissella diestrammenae TaxID=1162633 RepID=A0A7G9T450_9LACO|nr:5-(carboxyamino)imidazole ribonucleotide synthase [Weissella diestrammenae]MCM0583396.1 5-(carboxyamino)imidazole ribonucleotide synthase [Weissella diestrammenae]QNN74875.1 5-(carboxyamino)imidazole ribonucleotide synthase [Weissella diestrammenae]
MNKVILPPATIGIVGGGQLGQMLALSAKAMGYRIIVLDPTANAPAVQVADEAIIAAYTDESALLQLAEQSDVLTYEFENISLTTLQLASKRAALPQGTKMLALTKNRLREKDFLSQHAIPVANYEAINSPEALKEAVKQIKLPAILKTAEGGYDGHGQWDIGDLDDLAQLLEHWPVTDNQELILEEKINFNRELSVMVTMDGTAAVRTWPIVENEHVNHVLNETRAPAVLSLALESQIQTIATSIAQALNLRGVLGIEMFVQGETVYVNELAPRPHNSGHYSIEATNISQFEGHIRSIVGLAIPPIKLLAPSLMHNLLGTTLLTARQDFIHHPEWHFHDYGKADIKAGRKMGHITVLGNEDVQQLHEWGQQHGEN